ncbi:MAG: CHAT domain-containing protein [Anaerolineae bacterium]
MTNHNADVDLQLRIFPQQDAGYPVEITLGRHQVFPRGYLAADVTAWTPGGDPTADGLALAELLLADTAVREAWIEARAQAPRRRIRLWIDTDAAELHTLPWELLQDEGKLLAASSDTPFSRFLPVKLPWRGALEGREIRVLAAISNPDDLEAVHGLSSLDVAQERATLDAVVGAANADGYTLDITYLEPPITLERLEAALREGYAVLHYVGHGAYNARQQQTVLYLQDDAGHAQLISDDALVSMLARQDARPQLVFLAACQSATRSTADAFLGLGPKLITVGVPAVVAMQDFVSIESARKLNGVFYGRLAQHGQVDRALNEARGTLLTAGRPDVTVPVLLTRLESGQLWGAEADARGEMLGDRNPRIFWSGLVKYIQTGKCTPIIGPRARVQWLPDPTDIARAWAAEYGYPFSDKTNPNSIAQYMAISQGEDFPRYELLEALQKAFERRVPESLRAGRQYQGLHDLVDAVGWQTLTAGSPHDVHAVLASLNLPLYLTTNMDNFMTEALEAQGKHPVREICRWNEALDGLPSIFDDDPNYTPTPETPLVYHLFGNEQEVASMVLTEDAHLEFTTNIAADMQRIHPCIWAALANSSLMFLGYRLNDWGFRVLLRGLIAPQQQRRRFKHVGVQLEPDDVCDDDLPAVHEFMRSYFQDNEINVYVGTILQFIAELQEYWEAAN